MSVPQFRQSNFFVLTALFVAVAPTLSFAETPKPAPDNYRLGVEALGRKDYGKAITLLSKVRWIKLPVPRFTSVSADRLTKARPAWDRAIADYTKAIRLTPNSPRASPGGDTPTGKANRITHGPSATALRRSG